MHVWIERASVQPRTANRVRGKCIQGSRFLVFTFLPFRFRPVSPPSSPSFKFTRLTRMEGGCWSLGKSHVKYPSYFHEIRDTLDILT